MKPVTDLYDRYPGADIYVVGSGTSMRVFPVAYLEDKITIGLNMAWRNAPVRYGITIGPHLNVPEFMDGEVPHPEITWITKAGKAEMVLTPEQFAHADAEFYSFEVGGKAASGSDWVTDAGRVLDWVRRPSGVMLYQWSSISQTAANLAANMGARNVILVGCDNTSLAGNHHAHAQHTKWLGEPPDVRYEEYYEGLVEIRAALRERGVNLLSMSPFVKLDDPVRDFERLCAELERPLRIAPGADISAQDHPSRFGLPGARGARRATSLPHRAARKALRVGRRALARARSGPRA